MQIIDQLITNIVVVGGGPSGLIAALAAAREGETVTLLERYGFLGGCTTMSLVVPLMTFHAGDKQIIKGYAQELIERIAELNGTTGHITDPLGVAGSITPVDTDVYKSVAQEMLLEAGVDLRYHSEVVDLVSENNLINSLLVKTRSGFYQVEAEKYVDATGDGDLAYLAGNPVEIGRKKDGKCQPMTMMFKVGNVNLDKIIELADQTPEDFMIHPEIDSLSSLKRVAISGFFKTVESARRKNELKVNRDRVLFFELDRRGVIGVNMSRVIDKIATKGFELSEATIEGRRQVFNIMDFFRKYLPGFADAELLESGCQIGVRESRRIKGDYILTELDVIAGRGFVDAIAQGSWPIDIHDPAGQELEIKSLNWGDYYQIPYRCMLPQNTDNLIVTGRAISTTHQAFASTRVSPICMALGQAAGTAAAIARKEGTSFRELPYDLLYQTLISKGQAIEPKSGRIE